MEEIGFLQSNNLTENYNAKRCIDYLNNITFNQFDFVETKYDNQNNPDANYFDGFSDIINSCSYYFMDDFTDLKPKFGSDMLSVCSFNVNSLSKNIDEFLNECIIDKLPFDILGFTETKLTDSIQHLYDIEGYQRFNLNYKRNSGGVALYVTQSIQNIRVRSDLQIQTVFLECLFVEFNIENDTYICGILYHRPGSSRVDFNNELSNLLGRISREKKKVIIMGDFNSNLLSHRDSLNITNFINTFHSNNMFNLINKPTRVMNNSATIIDHIWTNNYKKVILNGIIYSSITDHFPVFSIFSLKDHKVENPKKIKHSYRDFSDSNILNFKDDLRITSWDSVFLNDDPQGSYENFNNIYLSLFNKNFPLITKFIKVKHINKPYITPDILVLMKQRDKLQKLYARKPITYENAFKSLRNEINKKVRLSKNKYFKNRLNESVGDSKSTWKVLSDILHRTKNVNKTQNVNFIINNQHVKDPNIVSNRFNEHYVNVGEKLASEISVGDGDFRDFLSLSPNEFSGFTETNELEIVNIIINFKNASPGFDDVPMSVVKKTVHEIKHQLVHIFNLSLMLGIFPNKLKIAKVIPIFKKGTKNDMNNYRPISVLPAFSKVLEKIVYNRFIVFIESNNLLSRSQYGFRQNRSTTAAVLQLADHILQEFDKNKFVIGIFLDFTKAFETVDHQILLSKMEHMGVRGVALQWFKNYLENRPQLVV